MIRRGLDATISIVNLVQGANFRRKNNLECFVAGTLVETQDGPLPIEQVREGDWVLAWDEDAGDLCWSRVEQTFVTPRQPIWRLTLKLPGGSEESLDCTPGHPFWANGEGWVSACHLQPGQDVATLSGPARVASVAPTGRNRTVYNFEVEGTHCYFVGTGGGLVHNGPCTDPPRKHHSYPKYLGGKAKQKLVELPKSVHDSYHSGLDKVLPRRKTTQFYLNQRGSRRRQTLTDLDDYTKAFDKEYGTNLRKAMRGEGFKRP